MGSAYSDEIPNQPSPSLCRLTDCVWWTTETAQLAGGNEDNTIGGGIDRRRFLLSDLDCAQIQSRWRRRQFLVDNQEDILDGGINKRRFRLANIDCELLSNPRWGK